MTLLERLKNQAQKAGGTHRGYPGTTCQHATRHCCHWLCASTSGGLWPPPLQTLLVTQVQAGASDGQAHAPAVPQRCPLCWSFQQIYYEGTQICFRMILANVHIVLQEQKENTGVRRRSLDHFLNSFS